MTSFMETNKLLRIYLNDHYAGSVAGDELAKRSLKNNQGTPLGDYLSQFIAELEEDQRVLLKVLDAIDAKPDRIKQMAAWIAEKAGRFKLNGQVTGYSDLSRLLEIEGLALAVEGKVSLWRSLERVRDDHPELSDIDLATLIERGERQREQLERFRLEAAVIALKHTES
ncbi:MAG: hypothetical protein M3N53_02040 [Actinomycetota bacterium]|nr:hypothetical protein [Actinomycetota bacterium]